MGAQGGFSLIPQQKTIYLVRHGLTAWNEEHRLQGRTPGIYLSEKGRAQAEQTAFFLKDVPFDSLVTSPLERAVQTAEIIGRYHKVPLIKEEGFSEWVMDTWEGFYFEEIKAKFPKEYHAWEADPSLEIDFGGETLHSIQKRCIRALHEHVKACKKTILIVSHGDPLRALIARLLHIPLKEIRSFEVTNASITKFHYEKDYILDYLNLVPESR